MDKKVLDDLLELFKQGLGDKKKYDWVRKILAIVPILTGDADVKNPEPVAQQADEATNNARLQSEVDNGNMTEEQAAEEMQDRKAASFVTLARQLAARGVEAGCIALGATIGAWLGNPVIGKMIGGMVGRFLNKPVGEVAEIVAGRLLDFTTRMVTAARERIREEWGKLKGRIEKIGEEQIQKMENKIRGKEKNIA